MIMKLGMREMKGSYKIKTAGGQNPAVFCCHAYEKRIRWILFEYRNL